ncbi:Methylmalonyl-CoA mutase [Pseudonocardia dioxanivorans CB1190]|uniref:Methylmalonyl-CoA mutase n=1 Tax=Pseudonocardia dioxanivorans (strain ATCC 55486 / DSM 44775 / JCM 13855 / CB1190) TaxID=675635 RepID=F4CT22_PSEUX|nr:methylmalonyl-CoA mutase family protein [Pseudonocardia dioxanivorans]AEA25321.1 Methylmalonyl-CoA mutase [Pseudonocardia dioxanivorans CB1190]
MTTPQVDPDALERGAPEEPDDLALAAEFPAATREEWAALVDGVLRKAGRLPADAPAGSGVDVLVRETLDGLRVRPLYTADDVPDLAATGVPGAAPYVRGSRAGGYVPDGWDIRARHTSADPAAVAAAVAEDLDNGVTSLWLGVGTHGVAVADLPAALEGVLLDLAPVVLDAGADAIAAAEAFLAHVTASDVDPAQVGGNLGLDPVGLRAATGEGPDVESVLPLARRVADDFPAMRAIVVDALPVHGAGASDAQQLGWSLAAGVAYLRALTGAGLDVATAARLLEFRFGVTGDQFATIALLRAARRLWARVLEACGAPDAPGQVQHAVTSPMTTTRRDPWVNMLRGTVAGFAAGVGGADAVTVAPFDEAIGVAEPFSRRIARNTQSLLIMEAHLARVVDPAGGSWYVESRTDELARAAWTFFQEVEGAGGAVAALDSGFVAERVAPVRERRERDVATRRTPITGVSEFPDLDERPVERAPHPAPAAAGGLPVYRLAGAFEERRDRSDAVLAATGARPAAFLATLGTVAAHSARAGFARNLLGAGGIATPDAGATASTDEIVAAFGEAATPVAVLCGTDEAYAESAAATAAALREAGATRILLAGRAEVDGVDATLHAGCDALAVIDDVYAALDAANGEDAR